MVGPLKVNGELLAKYFLIHVQNFPVHAHPATDIGTGAVGRLTDVALFFVILAPTMPPSLALVSAPKPVGVPLSFKVKKVRVLNCRTMFHHHLEVKQRLKTK